MRTSDRLVVGLLSMFLFAMIPVTIGSHYSEDKGKSHDSESSLSNKATTFSAENPMSMILRPNNGADLGRHIRSVDQGIQQSQSNEQLLEEEDGTQSNSGNTSDDPDLTHKSQRSLVSSTDMLRYTPTILMSRENKYPLSRWYLPGFNHFSRGGRAERNGFIRFGRNGNFDESEPNLMNSKKSNFIRLGRENPRQNNFIRLGRSGLRGTKIGYFPDYYSNIYGSTPSAWTYGDLTPPLPYNPADTIGQV